MYLCTKLYCVISLTNETATRRSLVQQIDVLRFPPTAGSPYLPSHVPCIKWRQTSPTILAAGILSCKSYYRKPMARSRRMTCCERGEKLRSRPADPTIVRPDLRGPCTRPPCIIYLQPRRNLVDLIGRSATQAAAPNSVPTSAANLTT